MSISIKSVNLSYLELNLAKDGTVLTRDQIRDERIRRGYCTECRGEPVRLFNIKRSRYNPLYSSRIACNEPGKTLNGQCLICNPELKVITAKVRTVRVFNAFRASKAIGASESAEVIRLAESMLSDENSSNPRQTSSLISTGASNESNNIDYQSESECTRLSSTSVSNKSNDTDGRRIPNETANNGNEQEKKETESIDESTDYMEKVFDRKRSKSVRRILRQPSVAVLDGVSNKNIEVEQSDVTSDQEPSYGSRISTLRNSMDLPKPVQDEEAKEALDTPPEREQINASTPPATLYTEGHAVIISEMKSLIKDVTAASNNCDFAVDILIDCMKNNPDCIAIQEFCLLNFSSLCAKNDNYKKSIVSSSAPDDILLTMKNHLSHAPIQQRGCGALWSLCNDKKGCAIKNNLLILTRAGSLARIIKAIIEHIYDEDVVSSGIGCLRSLSPVHEAQDALGVLSGTEHVCKAMNVHQDIVTIQRDGCAFLTNCAVDLEKQQVALASMLELETVTNVIKTHRHDPSVLAAASFALKNYTFEERNVRRLTQVDGIVRLMENACQLSEGSQISRDVSIILDRILESKSNDESLENHLLENTLNSMIADANVEPEKKVQQVIDLMEEYDWSCKVLAEVFGGLTLLCQYYPRQRMTVGSTKVIETVIAHMKTYKSFAQIQINSCELFTEVLKDADSLSTTILDAGGCEVIMEMMLDHKSDANVQIAATSVLKVLSKEIECWLTLLRSGFSIEEIMAAHPENQLIQGHGLEIITNLSFHDGTDG